MSAKPSYKLAAGTAAGSICCCSSQALTASLFLKSLTAAADIAEPRSHSLARHGLTKSNETHQGPGNMLRCRHWFTDADTGHGGQRVAPSLLFSMASSQSSGYS